MAHVTDAGLVMPDAGDTVQMGYYLKARDYGRYDRFPPLADVAPVTWPQIVVHHITDSIIDADEYDIDMVARGKVYAAMKWHTQSYFGLNGQGVQIIPVNRAATGVSGSAIFRGKKREVNNLAFHIEWVSMLLNPKGEKWVENEKTKKLELRYRTDPKRTDLVAHFPPAVPSYLKGWLWLKVPDEQREAIGDVLVALQAKLNLDPANLFHGHFALGRGSHVDPGPEVIAALARIGRERFKLPEDFVPLAAATDPVPLTLPDNPPRSF